MRLFCCNKLIKFFFFRLKGDNLTHFQDVSVLNENDAEAFDERKKSASRKRKGPKLPRKMAKKMARRSKARSNRRKMNL